MNLPFPVLEQLKTILKSCIMSITGTGCSTLELNCHLLESANYVSPVPHNDNRLDFPFSRVQACREAVDATALG